MIPGALASSGMGLLLLVTASFRAFSTSGVVALPVGPNRDRLHQYLFAAVLNAVWGPHPDAKPMPTWIRLASKCAFRWPIMWCGVIIGAVSLISAISGIGLQTKPLQWWVCGSLIEIYSHCRNHPDRMVFKCELTIARNLSVSLNARNVS